MLHCIDDQMSGMGDRSGGHRQNRQVPIVHIPEIPALYEVDDVGVMGSGVYFWAFPSKSGQKVGG